MAYRNGTYIAFHARGTTDPTASDIKYFNIMKAWSNHPSFEFGFADSHAKVSAVRDTSAAETLKRSLRERLNNSKNMVLIVGKTTKSDTDWVPFEIAYAVDKCEIPIIAVYPDYPVITKPSALAPLWPKAFNDRILNNTVRAIHIPFKQAAIYDAIRQFSHNCPPATALNHYSVAAHRAFGIDA